MITIHIKKPGLFSFRECLWFLSREHDDDSISYQKGYVARVIRIDGNAIPFILFEVNGELYIQLSDEHNTASIINGVKLFVEDWFDLKREITPFYKLLAQHADLQYMAADFEGLRVIGNPDTFETLMWSIMSQQINMTFALKLKRVLTEKYGKFIEYNGHQLPLFPLPETLASLQIQDLQNLQFSRQKASYIINAAAAFASGELSKEKLLALSSAERIVKLTSLKGVGLWTANAVLMQSLGDVTGLPLGDVGLLKALENHNLIADRKDIAGITALFNQFEGWQSYLFNYLWRSLSGTRRVLISDTVV